MSIGDLQFHPLSNIFPLIDGQAYADLCADVAKFGIREPVWLYDGQILDGRNRWRAANETGAECPTRTYEGDEPAAFVVSLNLHRRHLSESQRAMVAAKLANMPVGRPAGNSANLQNLPTSQSDAADMLNVSTRAVAAAAKVQREAQEPIVAAVERGDMTVSLAAKVMDLPEEEQAPILAAQPGQIADVARTITKAHVANNSGNNEWYTPAPFIAAARAVMGGIDLDPASSEIANRTVQAAKFYTAETDGRLQEWAGRVWMNPPYAQPLIADFCEALATRVEAGSVTAACVLVNNGTETAWFQRLLDVASAVCLIRGRVKFLDPDGNPGAPLQGQAVVYIGDKRGQFAEHFRQFGKVLYA